MSTTKLAEAARAVIDRWDSPAWKDAPHTGEYIHALRQALASYEAAQAEAKPADPGQLAYDIWAAANRPNVGIEGQIEGVQAVLDREAKPAPAGFVLVPVEPTEQMMRAAFLAVESEGVSTTPWLRGTIWNAMLAAAPAAPAQAKPLTDEQLNALIPSAYVGDSYVGYSRTDLCKLARAIEAHHGIGIAANKESGNGQ